MAGMRFIQSQARVELLNQLNGEKVFGITWMADRYDTEKYKRRKPWRSRGAGVIRLLGAWGEPIGSMVLVYMLTLGVY